MDYIKQPHMIEAKSFEIIQQIITEQRPEYQFCSPLQERIIKRVIHTTADFDWLDILHFSAQVTTLISSALQRGASIYTDTSMALSGINKQYLDRLGCRYYCYISDERVRITAKQHNITRSMAAVDLALQQPGEKIFVFGNAPTALFRLLELMEKGIDSPVAVIGVPVGFVGAAESKAALINSQLPNITSVGRKGGSNIAAAIINALLYEL